jgi:hypothetical protein
MPLRPEARRKETIGLPGNVSMHGFDVTSHNGETVYFSVLWQ